MSTLPLGDGKDELSINPPPKNLITIQLAQSLPSLAGIFLFCKLLLSYKTSIRLGMNTPYTTIKRHIFFQSQAYVGQSRRFDANVCLSYTQTKTLLAWWFWIRSRPMFFGGGVSPSIFLLNHTTAHELNHLWEICNKHPETIFFKHVTNKFWIIFLQICSHVMHFFCFWLSF